MIIDGFEYRYANIVDPPTPCGVGVEDPDAQYWITDGEVFYRPHPPVSETWRLVGCDHPLQNLRIYLFNIPPLPGGWTCRYAGQTTISNSLCGLCRTRGGWDGCIYTYIRG